MATVGKVKSALTLLINSPVIAIFLLIKGVTTSASEESDNENDKSRLLNYFSKYKKDLPSEILKYEQTYLKKQLNRLVFSAKLVDEVSKGRKLKILDLGSLGGYLAFLLKCRGHDVYALDKKRIETKFWKSRFDREYIRFDICDLTREKIPFEDQQFDVILFFEIIEHLPIYPIFVVQEIKRILKKGGVVLLSTPNFLRLTSRIQIVLGKPPYSLESFDMERGTGHFREFTSNELVFLMERLGFLVLEIEYRFFGAQTSGLTKIFEFVQAFLSKIFSSLNATIVLTAKKVD